MVGGRNDVEGRESWDDSVLFYNDDNMSEWGFEAIECKRWKK